MAKEKTATNPNEDLGVDEINYLELTQKEVYEKYKGIEAKLLLRNKYDFDLWKATTVTEKEFNKQTGNVDDVIVGLTLISPEPIQQSRMTWRMAMEINSHVDHSMNSKYMLLSKGKSEKPRFV